ncbi:hypothetical protein [Enterobacter bugandensis]
MAVNRTPGCSLLENNMFSNNKNKGILTTEPSR